MSQELKKITISVIGSVFAIALGVNTFFVKRLVDEIDATKRIAMDVQTDLRVLRAEIGLRTTADFDDPTNAVFNQGD